jgi:predicted phosphoribosyltransferase
LTERLIIELSPVERLAETVARLRLHAPVVLGLPPGGLLTASRVARALQAPLDMLLPRHADTPISIGHGIAWPALAGRSAVIVDDGDADPLDWHAALASLRPMQPDCLAIVVPELNEAIQCALANEYEHLFDRNPLSGRALRTGSDRARQERPARGRTGT